ncbi:cation-translocating P-type ATPase [Pseudomonas defluvii]|uniref:cation-translocating P-type ATPase n=1 Tax=Pseudomonas defluvii TaxID=1876757 RepID=UPI003905857E
MNIHQLSVSDALASLHTTAQGLSSGEAQRRLQQFGPNHVAPPKRRNRLWALLAEFTQLFSVVLWIAALLAFAVEWQVPGEGMGRLGVAIVAVILISGVFSYWQEYRIEKALSALVKLLPQQVQVQRDGTVQAITIDDLVPGDLMLLAEGDSVPADGRLIEASGMRVNNATITGEATAELRDASACDSEDRLHARNIVLAGTSITSGKGTAVVFATGLHTEFGRIAHLTQVSGDQISPLRLQIIRLSRSILALSLGISVLFFFLGNLFGVPFWEDLIFAIGLIVAMVPEGLLPTLTLALVLATQRMARQQVLIRHLPCVEALGSVTVICTDKTGTLTQNCMTVQTVWLDGSEYSGVEQGLPAALCEANLPFFWVAGLCHNVRLVGQGETATYCGDPMEQALMHMAAPQIAPWNGAQRIDELPFDAVRMCMSVIYDLPEGRVLLCKGALEKLLPLCESTWHLQRPEPLSRELRANILNAQERMADRGLRVLALAWRWLPHGQEPCEQGLILAGLAGLQDPPRPEVPAAIMACRQAGIKTIMVTGDHPHTAVAIARQIGLVTIASPLVLSGEQISNLSHTQLLLALDAPQIICARISADQKLRIVTALEGKGEIVAVTGDGVNDAPALKHAHVGIAMGVSGTDVAREAADMVLLDDNFASIVSAIAEGRAVFDNIRKFLTYILAHNMAELIPYLCFALARVPLAITPLQMLAIDMGTDSLTALGLGVERADAEIMRRPPRPPKQRLFSLALALRGYLVLGLVEALGTLAAFFFVLTRGGWTWGQALPSSDALYLQGTTASMVAIVVLQIVNVFMCRSASRSCLQTGLRGNRLITWGVMLEVLLILVFAYTPWGNQLLGTSPVSWQVWLLLIPFVLALIGLEELRKYWSRRRIARKAAHYV